MDHLAALTALTSLAYGVEDEGADPIGAISQLTRLRSLQLEPPSRFSNEQLTQLSALCCVTSLHITGWLPMQLLDCTPISCACLPSFIGPLCWIYCR